MADYTKGGIEKLTDLENVAQGISAHFFWQRCHEKAAIEDNLRAMKRAEQKMVQWETYLTGEIYRPCFEHLFPSGSQVRIELGF